MAYTNQEKLDNLRKQLYDLQDVIRSKYKVLGMFENNLKTLNDTLRTADYYEAGLRAQTNNIRRTKAQIEEFEDKEKLLNSWIWELTAEVEKENKEVEAVIRWLRK